MIELWAIFVAIVALTIVVGFGVRLISAWVNTSRLEAYSEQEARTLVAPWMGEENFGGLLVPREENGAE